MYREYPDNIVIRDFSKGDLDAFHGENKPRDPTIAGWTGEKDGEVRVIGGLARGEDFRMYAFLDLKKDDEEARSYDILIGRFAKMFMDEVARSDVKYIYALVDHDERAAAQWMERLGFELDPRTKTFMRWKKKEI